MNVPATGSPKQPGTFPPSNCTDGKAAYADAPLAALITSGQRSRHTLIKTCRAVWIAALELCRSEELWLFIFRIHHTDSTLGITPGFSFLGGGLARLARPHKRQLIHNLLPCGSLSVRRVS